MVGGGVLPHSVDEEIFMGGYPRLYDKGLAPDRLSVLYAGDTDLTTKHGRVVGWQGK